MIRNVIIYFIIQLFVISGGACLAGKDPVFVNPEKEIEQDGGTSNSEVVIREDVDGEIKVVNVSDAEKSSNVASGKGAVANRGSVIIEESGVSTERASDESAHRRDRSRGGSVVTGKIINKSEIDNSSNVARGRNSRANTGSVVVRDSEISGEVVNESKVSGSKNSAEGPGAEANMGSIVID